MSAAISYAAASPPVARRAMARRWADLLSSGLVQGLCGPALQGAVQAQLPALGLDAALQWPGASTPAAGRVAFQKGVPA